MNSWQLHPNQDTITTDRNGILECTHVIHAAIVDSTGQLLYTVGDASRTTLFRSAAKPAQALAIAETDCLERFGFDDADLALICASHSAEPRHLTRAQSMLDRIGANEGNLRCGGHPSLNPDVFKDWAIRDFTPTPICNNCSGKHAGMLAGAKALGAEFDGYHLPHHPMQVRVKNVVEELCGDEKGEVQWGVDGCNLPAPATPLRLLARIFAHFATAADAVKGEDLPTAKRVEASRRIFQAMSQRPELVAGEGRFCTELMQTFQGALIGKVGADGCYGIGVRESEQTRRLGAQGSVGIAVKVEDGKIEILYSAVMEILEQLQIGTAEMRQQLKMWKKDNVLNTADVVTGKVHHNFRLRPNHLTANKAMVNGVQSRKQ